MVELWESEWVGHKQDQRATTFDDDVLSGAFNGPAEHFSEVQWCGYTRLKSVIYVVDCVVFSAVQTDTYNNNNKLQIIGPLLIFSRSMGRKMQFRGRKFNFFSIVLFKWHLISKFNSAGYKKENDWNFSHSIPLKWQRSVGRSSIWFNCEQSLLIFFAILWRSQGESSKPF